MAVKEHTKYLHYGNGKTYTFLFIALPFSSLPDVSFLGRAEALHTEDEVMINLYAHGNVAYSERDEYLAIYTCEGKTYARPVDMFFEHVDGKTKRFTEVKEDDDANTGIVE